MNSSKEQVFKTCTNVASVRSSRKSKKDLVSCLQFTAVKKNIENASLSTNGILFRLFWSWQFSLGFLIVFGWREQDYELLSSASRYRKVHITDSRLSSREHRVPKRAAVQNFMGISLRAALKLRLSRPSRIPLVLQSLMEMVHCLFHYHFLSTLGCSFIITVPGLCFFPFHTRNA